MRDISSIKSTSSFKSLLKEGTETSRAPLPLVLTFNPRPFSIDTHLEAGIAVPSILFAFYILKVIFTSFGFFVPTSDGFETDSALADSYIKDAALSAAARHPPRSEERRVGQE